MHLAQDNCAHVKGASIVCRVCVAVRQAHQVDGNRNRLDVIQRISNVHEPILGTIKDY